MSPTPGGRRLATVTVPAPDLRPGPFLLHGAGGARGLWARGERWVAHRGIAAELRGTMAGGDRFDRLVLKARFKYLGDARQKLTYAAYVYRNAALEFADMLAYAEVDELRLTLKALLDDLDRRLVRTFLKLGDLRYLSGDAPGALDAVHEVLSVDPGNKAAEDAIRHVVRELDKATLTRPADRTRP